MERGGGPLGAAVVAAAMQQVAAQQAAAAAAAAAAANSALSAPSELCSGCATREAAVAICSTCGASLCPSCIMAHQVRLSALEKGAGQLGRGMMVRFLMYPLLQQPLAHGTCLDPNFAV